MFKKIALVGFLASQFAGLALASMPLPTCYPCSSAQTAKPHAPAKSTVTTQHVAR